MNKVLLIDFNIFMFRAIFSWYKRKEIPPTYTALNMMLSCIRKVGLNKEDLVLIVLDSEKGSWRRELDLNYKATRKEQRSKYEINWDKMFTKFSLILQQLDMYSPFHIIQLDYCEGDDIIATATKFFKDKECIIVSYDTDYEMLVIRNNVKIFSPLIKRYKHIKDPYKVLSKKIEKEITDNLVTPILSEKDYEVRNRIVNLLDLPTEVEEKIINRLSNLPNKEWDYDKLPFNGLKQKFKDIYKQDKVVDYNYKPRKRKGG